VSEKRVLRLEIPIETDEELAALEGALLAARATELSQIRRRGTRQALGYGSNAARETMSDEVNQAERRWTMLDRLLAALKASAPQSHRTLTDQTVVPEEDWASLRQRHPRDRARP
jgi:hypothetical protein